MYCMCIMRKTCCGHRIPVSFRRGRQRKTKKAFFGGQSTKGACRWPLRRQGWWSLQKGRRAQALSTPSPNPRPMCRVKSSCSVQRRRGQQADNEKIKSKKRKKKKKHKAQSTKRWRSRNKHHEIDNPSIMQEIEADQARFADPSHTRFIITGPPTPFFFSGWSSSARGLSAKPDLLSIAANPSRPHPAALPSPAASFFGLFSFFLCSFSPSPLPCPGPAQINP